MTKHCTRCHRRWSVSVQDEQEYYICPDCEQREKGPGQAGPGVGEKYYKSLYGRRSAMPKLPEKLKAELMEKVKAYETGEITFEAYTNWCEINGFMGRVEE